MVVFLDRVFAKAGEEKTMFDARLIMVAKSITIINLIGNLEGAKYTMIQNTSKYNFDTNKCLRENIYEIHYAYNNLTANNKSKIFDMDFVAL